MNCNMHRLMMLVFFMLGFCSLFIFCLKKCDKDAIPASQYQQASMHKPGNPDIGKGMSECLYESESLGESMIMNAHGTENKACDYLLDGFEREGADVEFYLLVIDEDGRPLTNANITVSHTIGDGEEPKEYGRTDDDGSFHFKGLSNWAVGWNVRCDGFYESSSNMVLRPFATELGWEERRWFKHPPTLTVTIKRMIRPHKMPYRNYMLTFPPNYSSVCVDLCSGLALSSSNANAHVDVCFKSDPIVWDADNSSRTLTIEFPNPGDGAILVHRDGNSSLHSPRFAPQTGYASRWNSTMTIEQGRTVKKQLISSEDYLLFRIRSKMSVSGEVTNALYGKMRGDWFVNGKSRILRFKTWINEECNDTNLEDLSGRW